MSCRRRLSPQRRHHTLPKLPCVAWNLSLFPWGGGVVSPSWSTSFPSSKFNMNKPTPNPPASICWLPLSRPDPIRLLGAFILLNFLVPSGAVAQLSTHPSLFLLPAVTVRPLAAGGPASRLSPFKVSAQTEFHNSQRVRRSKQKVLKILLLTPYWLPIIKTGQWPWIIVHISGRLRMIGALWDLSLSMVQCQYTE